ncbi:MAG: family 1 glycosylhydrolase, partial [Sphingomicrobium sp.]
GINYYTRGIMSANAAHWPVQAHHVRKPGATYTETGWEVYEDGLTEALLWAKQRYGDIPLYVTENGAAFYDPPKIRGTRVQDPLRVDYLKRHLRALHKAIEQGADVRGYLAWSLLDNLEWSLGYSKQFGIVHVDHETQVRTPKDSARFYAQVIASNGAVLSEEDS